MGIPWDFMYKIMTFKFSKPRLSPSCSCWWNLLAIFHPCSPFLSWYVNTHAYIHTHIFTHAHVYTYAHVCAHVQVYIHVHIHAYLHELCTYMLYALCTYACVHMNTHICEHTHTQPKTMPPATRCWVTGLLSLPHPISFSMSQIRTKPLGN